MSRGHRAQERCLMTITTAFVPTTEASTGASRPSALRRVAVAVSAFVGCALPVTFTVTITAMLVTGTEADHRFHQLTGQGLILLALWMGSVLPLVRAGWAGRRPSTAACYRHLAFIGAGVVTSAVAGGGGSRARGAVGAVTGALVWAAIPLRPRLRGTFSVDPVLMPLALVIGAVLMPYAADQLALQNATTAGYHSQNPHLFDMAWMVTTITVLAVLGAVVRQARGLLGWVAGACTAIGAAGLATGASPAWSCAVLALGVVSCLAPRVTRSRNRH
jgi:hypothetical protein